MARYTSSSPRQGTGLALSLLSAVFFTWGFLSALNSVLVPHLQQVFQLSYTESMLIQAVFYSSPLLVCLPTARVMQSLGYKNTLLLGLGLVILGTLAFYPATEAFSFPLVLLAVLIVALGVAALQVVANPYVGSLGDARTASSRLTMTSGINSLGTTVAPYIGALALLSATGLSPQEGAALVQGPYLITALAVALLALVIKVLKLPEPAPVKAQANTASLPVWRYRHLLLGLLAIFCYTGVEVSIGSFLLSYLSDADLGGFSRATAGKLAVFFWGGAMVGRLVGSVVLRYMAPRKVLLFNVTLAAGLVLLAISYPGRLGGWALIAIGLCNSIMYPVIFSLAVDKLGDSTAQASGLLVMAGVGGAVLPMTQAMVADSSGLTLSLLIPLACYLMIMGYGVYGYKFCVLGEQQRFSEKAI